MRLRGRVSARFGMEYSKTTNIDRNASTMDDVHSHGGTPGGQKVF